MTQQSADVERVTLVCAGFSVHVVAQTETFAKWPGAIAFPREMAAWNVAREDAAERTELLEHVSSGKEAMQNEPLLRMPIFLRDGLLQQAF